MNTNGTLPVPALGSAVDGLTTLCFICGSILSSFRGFPSPALLECSSCGLLLTSHRPSRQELEQLYGKEYFQNHDYAQPGYADYLRDEPLIKKTFARRLKGLSRFVDFGKMLDIGCATGFSLDVAQERGFDPYGVDLSSFATAYAKERHGTRVFCGEVSEAPFLEGDFSAVTAWDYLEHVADPVAALKRIHALLHDGGIVAITTPDTSSIAAKIAGPRWLGFKEKEHINYFSKENLSLLLSQNGFTVLSAGRVGKYVRGILFLERAAHYFPMSGFVAGFLRSKRLVNFSFYLNPFDIVLVIAQKTSPVIE